MLQIEQCAVVSNGSCSIPFGISLLVLAVIVEYII